MSFEDLGLDPTLLRAVRAEGYSAATKIQAASIPAILEGRDVLGCAATGTGKTAAFALPTLHRLAQLGKPPGGSRRPIRALVLAPTRELALQICESFRVYGRHTGLKPAAIYGGVGQGSQVKALRAGVDILVATPGRLLDLMDQGYVKLAEVKIMVLDEADRMLDMGFIPDVRRIVAQTPRKRQTLLFSATLSADIRNLASQWLVDPADVRVAPAVNQPQRVEQSVLFVEKRHKLTMLTDWLQETAWSRVLVFTRTKHSADKVSRHLAKAGIPSDALHGNKSQGARQHALARFKLPKPLVLVATDIAARGLDVDEISHVVNFDLPADAESYVHRIGRTARAEATGIAVSLCDRDERQMLRAIERFTRQSLAVGTPPRGTLGARSDAGNPAGAGDSTARPKEREPRRHERRGTGPAGSKRADGPSGVPGGKRRRRYRAAV